MILLKSCPSPENNHSTNLPSREQPMILISGWCRDRHFLEIDIVHGTINH